MNITSKTLLALTISAISSHAMAQLDPSKAPSENFDLSKWKIVIPMEDTKPERKGKVMEIPTKKVAQWCLRLRIKR